MRRVGWLVAGLLGCATGEPIDVQDARVSRDGGRLDAAPEPLDQSLPADRGTPPDQAVDAAPIDLGPDASPPCVPDEERCDSIDNDCDGKTDEALSRACFDGPEALRGVGACVEGSQTCADGQWQACTGAGAPGDEQCDGLDNDCDTVTDEGEAGTLLTRACYDGPGGTADEGVCRRGQQACAAGTWGPCQEQALPSREICDGLDNDCNGELDDVPEGSCACEPGTERDCYGGPDGTAEVGVCRAGRQVCAESGLSWGPCEGAVLPQDETCDGTDEDCDGDLDEAVLGTGEACVVGAGACAAQGRTVCDGDRGEVVCDAAAGAPGAEGCNNTDDDCDGRIDEGLGLGAACSVGVGACRAAGQIACRDGVAACDAEPGLPAAELCDGDDDDCDGQIDEGLGLGDACAVGQGTCARAGVIVCREAAAACSVEPGLPIAERCNGEDDDCDGQVDEGEPGAGEACPTNAQGACGQGQTACRDGQRVCDQTTEPSPEICDGVDNDCDGRVDEAADGAPLREPCYDGFAGTEGVGPCRGGERLCVNGAWGACVGQVVPAPEICDGVDNDCDRMVDDVVGLDCVCEAGVEQPCYPGAEGTEGVGTCRAGRQRCRADGSGFGACVDAVVPAAELCNGLDDDCNGAVDDVPGAGEACVAGTGVCAVAGMRACVAGVLTCDAEPGAPGPETCNDLDDDCNGFTDDLPTLGTACTVGVGACARQGVVTCGADPQPSCDATAGAPGAETCNGLDDDCDGQTDEDLGGAACTVGQGVCQRMGSVACVGGALGCDVEPGPSAAETCNGLDDDCDGAADEDTAAQICTVGVGGCEVEGRTTCEAGVGACDAVAGQPQPEQCGGGDEDCDGQTDEGLACDPEISCEAARQAGMVADGVQVVQPPGAAAPVNVWCDQTTDGGGWTLVASTRGTTLNDAGGAWYADLTTLAPAAGHTHVWDGLRGLGRRHDVRFTCRDAEAAADAPMTVDLTFRDVTWYREITTGADADSCFSEDQGRGIDLPQPARTDNLGGRSHPLGTPWAPQSNVYANGDYLEGEDTCAATDDFTVDFDDRGMDSAQSDGTDWGEDDGSRKCGRSGLATGQWFVWAREVRTPSFTCPGDDRFEENDTADAAHEVRLGRTYHAILCGADRDWFAFTGTPNSCYRVDVGFVDAQGDIDISVFPAAGGAALVRGSSITDDESVVFTSPADGAVHFDVRGWQFAADQGNDFTLRVSTEACPAE